MTKKEKQDLKEKAMLAALTGLLANPKITRRDNLIANSVETQHRFIDDTVFTAICFAGVLVEQLDK